MVGVARSQACRNCKRKKKGCDLTRPICGQCARLGLTCGYEKKKWTFVNNLDLCNNGRHPQPVAIPQAQPIELDDAQTITVSLLPRSLRRSSLSILLEDQFWLAYLPRDDFLSCRYVGGVTVMPWVPAVRMIASQDDLARSALDALSLVAAGRQHDDLALSHEGAKLYTEVLSSLSLALRDLVKMQSDSVVASCGILSVYELFKTDDMLAAFPPNNDWERHLEASCQIVSMRGPKKHCTKTGYALYSQARKLSTLSGLLKKTPTGLFESDEWQKTSWRRSPPTLRDELSELTAQVPGLLQQQDYIFRKLSSPTGSDDTQKIISKGHRILENCINLATQLHDWETKTIALSIASEDKPSLTSSQEPINPSLSPTLQSISHLHGYAFFELTLSYFYTILPLYTRTSTLHNLLSRRIYTSSADYFSTTGTLPQLPAFMNHHSIAVSLCEGVEELLKPEAGLWGICHARVVVIFLSLYYLGNGMEGNVEYERVMGLMEGVRIVGQCRDGFGGLGLGGGSMRDVARRWYSGVDVEEEGLLWDGYVLDDGFMESLGHQQEVVV